MWPFEGPPCFLAPVITGVLFDEHSCTPAVCKGGAGALDPGVLGDNTCLISAHQWFVEHLLCVRPSAGHFEH